jgi:chromosome segregation ATPase
VAGPLVFWPNRKSALGLRACSKLPRGHRAPWSTLPPIAKGGLMGVVNDADVEAMRKVLGRLLLVMTDPTEAQQQKAERMLAEMPDEALALTASEALTGVRRLKTSFEGLENQLATLRKEIEQIRMLEAASRRELADGQKAIKERDDIAAKYKELQKQLDPEKQQLEIMYAVDAATVALKEETAKLRSELAQRQGEIETLRASKKRLREALDRLAGKD